MAVRIRMKKFGRRHRPFFRICAVDKRRPRNGRVIEELGTYDPINPKPEEQVRLKEDRIRYWLSVGATPSETVASMIRKAGIGLPPKRGGGHAKRKREKAKKKG